MEEQQSQFKMVEELIVDLRHAIPLKDLVKQKEWIADKMDGIRETLIRQEYNQKKKLDALRQKYERRRAERRARRLRK